MPAGAAHDVNDPGTSVYVDALIDGAAWDPGVIKYYFNNNDSDADWTAEEKSAFEFALDLYSSITNLEFVEATKISDANFDWQKWTNNHIGNGILGEHYLPYDSNGSQIQLEGHFNYKDSSWQNLDQGSYGFITIIHELGHGMGLDHPFDGTPKFPGSGTFNSGTYGLNQGIWTTMTYNDGWDLRPSKSDDYGWQGTLMALDIAALQTLYGTNMSTAIGNNVYTLPTANASGTFWTCIWDAGGTDTISNIGSLIACTIDLRPASLTTNDPNAGGFVSSDNGIIGGYTIANMVTIENAIGGDGNDIINGNDAVNDLQGGGGNDTIDGKGGADTMTGGTGDDLYFVDNVNDAVIEQNSGGNDTVLTTVAIATPAWVETVIMVDANTLVGTSANNTLTGNSNANTIIGLGGADKMSGLGGDDIYYVDNSGDKVIEAANAGTDTVHALINFTLGVNVENLIIDGSSAINGTGNMLVNTITGNAAANILNGLAGADIMIGGDGNDTYFVDNAGDVVTEIDNEGTDTVNSAVSHTLEDFVENLVLTGKTVNGTGNDLANMITGSTGNNILDGGLGIDTLIGLKGNDTYIIDGSDIIVEAAKGGTDTVVTSDTYTLGPDLENLILTGGNAIDGTGNALANVLTGNDFANRLLGLAGNDILSGGIGADTLNGGIGADTLTGGADGDTFQIDLIEKKGDIITDFVSGLDHLEITATGFANAVAGDVHLVANAKPVAADGNPSFLFDTDDGKLYWDDDGIGSDKPQLFATLTGVHALAAADLMIV